MYVPAGRFVLFNDIPNDRTLRWDECTNAVSTFERPCGYRNGQTLDQQGRVLACEQGGRRVVRTEHNGRRTVVAELVGGRRLNSPNDVVVGSDGTIWFTDPPYGIVSDYEGVRARAEIDGCHVYRVDPVSKTCRQVSEDFDRPNGLALSRDERTLYVADTARGHVRACEVTTDRLGAGRVFATVEHGKVDGVRLDALGNIWVAAGPALHCFHPDGTLLGLLHLPETCANFTFGGPKGNQLFVCATTSLYSTLLNINGAASADDDPQRADAGGALGPIGTAGRQGGLWLAFIGWCDPHHADAVREYEDAVLRLLADHDAELAFRGRRRVDQAHDLPAEVHILRFGSRGALTRFLDDPRRQALLQTHGAVFSSRLLVELDPVPATIGGAGPLDGDHRG